MARRNLGTIWIGTLFLVTAGGCLGYRSNFGSQGTIGQQRNEFVIHDPYPSNELGPPIVGGRPRGFDRPFAEATDVQGSPYARRNGRMPNY